jgi:hypothetical protein
MTSHDPAGLVLGVAASWSFGDRVGSKVGSGRGEAQVAFQVEPDSTRRSC